MSPRIDKAEVISFRLQVPLAALERLPDEVGPLALTVEAEEERSFRVTAGACTLRFRAAGERAVLTELTLAEDERGLFFQQVLGPLMVRHRGDLHVRLHWNVAERNSHGQYAEVRISQGITTYPGLSLMRNVVMPQPPGSARALFSPDEEEAGDIPDEEDAGAPRSAEEEEIARLLDEGRRQFEEYLRLKSRLQSQTP